MHYEQPLFRPPSEGNALILQATIGCSWNHCTYCAMYSTKTFRVRPLDDIVWELKEVRDGIARRVEKVFVADGDALAMPMDHWLAVLKTARERFPRLRRVSSYATAQNLLEKTPAELQALRDAGLRLLYLGPESGDDVTLKAIAKGATRADWIAAAQRARDAGIKISVIALLGAGGTAHSAQHAEATGTLITAMDPAYFSALSLTVVPGTPLANLIERGKFELPSPMGMLGELRTMVAHATPTATTFRTNHASNYLPLAGELPKDQARILKLIDAALDGQIPLRPEWSRGL